MGGGVGLGSPGKGLGLYRESVEGLTGPDVFGHRGSRTCGGDWMRRWEPRGIQDDVQVSDLSSWGWGCHLLTPGSLGRGQGFCVGVCSVIWQSWEVALTGLRQFTAGSCGTFSLLSPKSPHTPDCGHRSGLFPTEGSLLGDQLFAMTHLSD